MQKFYRLTKDIVCPDLGVIAQANDIVTEIDSDENGLMVETLDQAHSFYVNDDEIVLKQTIYDDGSVGYEYENGDFVELIKPAGNLFTVEPGAWGKVYGLRDHDKFRSSFDVQLGGWSRSNKTWGQSVHVMKWDVRPYTGEIVPFPEPPPPPPPDYSARIETYCLYVDNDERSLRNMMRLFGEILARKHGDRDRMLSEFLRKKHLSESKNIRQSVWAITMNRSAWMEVFEHYETKYLEGVR